MASGSGGEHAEDGERARDDDDEAGAEAAVPSANPLQKDSLVNDAIGKALRAHFQSLADAPLPDRFLNLLAELEARGTRDDR